MTKKQKQRQRNLIKFFIAFFRLLPAWKYTTKYGVFGKKRCPYRWVEYLLAEVTGQNGLWIQELIKVDEVYISKLKLTPLQKGVNLFRPLQDIAAGKFYEYQEKTIKGRVIAALKDSLKKLPWE